MALSSSVRDRWGLRDEAEIGEGGESGSTVCQCPCGKLGDGCSLETVREGETARASVVGARSSLKRAGETLGLCTRCFRDEVVRVLLDDTSNSFEVGELDVVEGESHEGVAVEGGLPRGLEAGADGLQEVKEGFSHPAPVLDTDRHEEASLVECRLVPLGDLLRFAL